MNPCCGKSSLRDDRSRSSSPSLSSSTPPSKKFIDPWGLWNVSPAKSDRTLKREGFHWPFGYHDLRAGRSASVAVDKVFSWRFGDETFWILGPLGKHVFLWLISTKAKCEARLVLDCDRVLAWFVALICVACSWEQQGFLAGSPSSTRASSFSCDDFFPPSLRWRWK